jgi:S-adenosylmethionine:tRNA ribosyltransferase-isomerase
MKAAAFAVQRPHGARLLVVDERGSLHHAPRAQWVRFLRAGDLVVANDAATLPASLSGVHLRSALPIEVRLAGRRTLDVNDLRAFRAIVFGAGDHRMRTEDRAPPPALRAGDTIALGPLRATVQRMLDHPRLIELRLHGSADAIWSGIARHGKPIQYSHVAKPLALWDVWTPVAALPVAFEPPSAGFVLDWALLRQLRERGVGFATLTHAAGISSTGDATLDARLPFDEPYRIPASTVAAIEHAHRQGGSVVAIGTTVVRALEHAAAHAGALRAGTGVADQRIGAHSRLRLVNALVSGTHEPDSSHHELLRAFVPAPVLERVDAALHDHGYLTHEFGDSVLVRDMFTRNGATAPASTASRGSGEAARSLECAN